MDQVASSTATASTHGARDHARSQGGAQTKSMPFIPAREFPDIPADAQRSAVTWGEYIPGGRYATKVLARGTRLRLHDLDGAACAHLMLWRADASWERLNVADTVKVPWQAYITTGHPLLSDQGRVLATITSDTSGHHDALCGATTLAGNLEKYGAGAAESASPAARELLILAALKNGLGPRDVAPSLSFFHGVTVHADGSLASTGSGGPGRYVEFIVHTPLVVAIANTAHPLDPDREFSTTTLAVTAWQDQSALPGLAADLDSRDPEYQRAYLNTEDAWRAATHLGADQ